MSRVVLSIGSNIEREKHIRYALDALREKFAELRISPVYESSAVGFEGPDFFNLVVVIETQLSVAQLTDWIRGVEAAAGRVRGEKKFQSRNLDIDILLYGDVDLHAEGWDIPRGEITHAAYVLKPLVDLLPEARHPVTGMRFAELWGTFSDASQQLRQVQLKQA